MTEIKDLNKTNIGKTLDESKLKNIKGGQRGFELFVNGWKKK
ncbi:hypothetical protein [Leuconostoc mesenteroides]|nr:hypothetical protein [Leuconostoc mesenteroides]